MVSLQAVRHRSKVLSAGRAWGLRANVIKCRVRARAGDGAAQALDLARDAVDVG